MGQLSIRLRSRLTFAVIAAVAAAASVGALAPPLSAQTSDPEIRRIPGSTVYEVAANAAGETCDTKIGSHSVALASGENWPDALAGSALDRPLLLTTQAFLPAATRAYLAPCADHSKAKVLILGGTAAVSPAVEQDLTEMGFRVDRVAGADRYDTAHRAARLFAPVELPTVYLASGKNFADAVAAAPFITRETPLILSTPGSLHDQARRFLTNADRSIGGVTILGGTAALSQAVEDDVRSLGLPTRRIAGADRYATASLIARESLARSGCHPVRDIAVASGTVPYGGLAASSVRGPCQPLLLAPKSGQSVPESLAAFGEAWRLSVGDLSRAVVTGVGSANQVPQGALRAVATGSESGEAADAGGESASSDGAPDWEQLAASVVQVVCRDAAGVAQSHGSGFVVGDGRQVVTNHHVIVDDGNRLCAGLSVGVGGSFSSAPSRSIDASLMRSTRARDLALLSLDSAAALPALEIVAVAPKAGDAITVLGYPGVGGDTMTLTTGRYSGTTTFNGQLWIKTDAQISPGNSGGAAFDSSGRLVGVPTAVNPITFSDAGDVVGTLGLMVPAADVTRLMDGELGGPDDTEPFGDGNWTRAFGTVSGEAYIALYAEAHDHSMTGLYANVEPGLFVWCGDQVVVDFWSPVLRSWRSGPYIAGQIDYRNRERDGRVPVAYRIGGDDNPIEVDLWWPTPDNTGFVSGGRGADFVSDLLKGSGSLLLGWTNFDDGTEVILFPSMDGFANAYGHLEEHCN